MIGKNKQKQREGTTTNKNNKDARGLRAWKCVCVCVRGQEKGRCSHLNGARRQCGVRRTQWCSSIPSIWTAYGPLNPTICLRRRVTLNPFRFCRVRGQPPPCRVLLFRDRRTDRPLLASWSSQHADTLTSGTSSVWKAGNDARFRRGFIFNPTGARQGCCACARPALGVQTAPLPCLWLCVVP